MAYQTGAIANATDAIHDLMAALVTFVDGLTGWVIDVHDTTLRYATMHLAAPSANRRDLYVSFRWDSTTKFRLAMYQSTGFVSAATLPHNQTGDSGNGSTSSPATTERRVNFEIQGEFAAYHFFAVDTGDSPYVHVVVESAANTFHHFGFGFLDKFNDWVGGEYVYGGFWNRSLGTAIDVPTSQVHSLLLDNCTTVDDCATMRVEGLPGQGGTGKWGVLTSSATPGNDTAGIARVGLRGCSRSGGWGYPLAWMPTSQLNAYKPIIPIDVFYFRETGAPDTWYPLGRQPDVGIINMKNLVVGQEIALGGGEVWKCFPWVKKQYTNPPSDQLESWNAGYAYRKRT